jgi:hypothetical protein
MRWEQSFIDVGDSFSPAVEKLNGVIPMLDPRHGEHQAALLIDRDPCLRIRDVEIRVGPRHVPRLSMDEPIPFEPLLKVQLLLAKYQQAAEKIDVAIADLLVTERWCSGLCGVAAC